MNQSCFIGAKSPSQTRRDCKKQDLTIAHSHIAEKKQIQLEMDCPTCPGTFDRGRMHQVVTNLPGNAIKFTQPGGRIGLSVEAREAELHLRVADNGPGIAGSSLPHIFDRFYRAHTGSSEGQRSTGLGLAITRVIVEAHGGSIEAQSELGRGSTFHVRMPCGATS